MEAAVLPVALVEALAAVAAAAEEMATEAKVAALAVDWRVAANQEEAMVAMGGVGKVAEVAAEVMASSAAERAKETVAAIWAMVAGG